MEHLCKVELIGRVGSAIETIVNNERVVKFSVAVSEGVFTETVWFDCSYRGDRTIEKEEEIHLEGRMVSHCYMDMSGEIRQTYEVKVNKIF